MTDPRIANALPRTGPGNSSWMNAVTAGHEHAAREPLDHPRDDQLEAVLRQPAEQARDREQRQAR